MAGSSIGYSLGIGSGLDIKTLVENLSAAEKAPKEALIKKREELNAAKVSALPSAWRNSWGAKVSPSISARWRRW